MHNFVEFSILFLLDKLRFFGKLCSFIVIRGRLGYMLKLEPQFLGYTALVVGSTCMSIVIEILVHFFT